MVLPNHPHNRPVIAQPLVEDPNDPVPEPSDKHMPAKVIRRDRRAVRPGLRREVKDRAFDPRIPGSDEPGITTDEQVARTLFPRRDDTASA